MGRAVNRNVITFGKDVVSCFFSKFFRRSSETLHLLPAERSYFVEFSSPDLITLVLYNSVDNQTGYNVLVFGYGYGKNGFIDFCPVPKVA